MCDCSHTLDQKLLNNNIVTESRIEILKAIIRDKDSMINSLKSKDSIKNYDFIIESFIYKNIINNKRIYLLLFIIFLHILNNIDKIKTDNINLNTCESTTNLYENTINNLEIELNKYQSTINNLEIELNKINKLSTIDLNIYESTRNSYENTINNLKIELHKYESKIKIYENIINNLELELHKYESEKLYQENNYFTDTEIIVIVSIIFIFILYILFS
jgi:hypothetical protein